MTIEFVATPVPIDWWSAVRLAKASADSSVMPALAIRAQRRFGFPQAIGVGAVDHHAVETQVHDEGEILADDRLPRRVPELDLVLAEIVVAEAGQPGRIAHHPV